MQTYSRLWCSVGSSDDRKHYVYWWRHLPVGGLQVVRKQYKVIHPTKQTTSIVYLRTCSSLCKDLELTQWQRLEKEEGYKVYSTFARGKRDDIWEL